MLLVQCVCEKCEQVLSYHVASNEEVTLIISCKAVQVTSIRKSIIIINFSVWPNSTEKSFLKRLIYGVVGKTQLEIFYLFLQPGVPTKIEGDKTMLRIYDFDYASSPPPEFLKCSTSKNHKRYIVPGILDTKGSHDFGAFCPILSPMRKHLPT